MNQGSDPADQLQQWNSPVPKAILMKPRPLEGVMKMPCQFPRNLLCLFCGIFVVSVCTSRLHGSLFSQSDTATWSPVLRDLERFTRDPQKRGASFTTARVVNARSDVALETDGHSDLDKVDSGTKAIETHEVATITGVLLRKTEIDFAAPGGEELEQRLRVQIIPTSGNGSKGSPRNAPPSNPKTAAPKGAQSPDLKLINNEQTEERTETASQTGSQSPELALKKGYEEPSNNNKQRQEINAKGDVKAETTTPSGVKSPELILKTGYEEGTNTNENQEKDPKGDGKTELTVEPSNTSDPKRKKEQKVDGKAETATPILAQSPVLNVKTGDQEETSNINMRMQEEKPEVNGKEVSSKGIQRQATSNKVRDQEGSGSSAHEDGEGLNGNNTTSIGEAEEENDGTKNDSSAAANTEGSATSVHLFLYDSPHCEGNSEENVVASGLESRTLTPITPPKSAKFVGKGAAVVFGSHNEYQGVIVELEGCVDLYNIPHIQKVVRFVLHTEHSKDVALTAKRQIPPELQKSFSTATDLKNPHIRIIFSATSSEYMGYQVYASAYSFLDSNQTNASWMRLLSASTPDDISERFPTFTAPRSLYSKVYTPVNKPDIIDKWMHSKDAPNPDDIIVVLDPDSWLIGDVYNYTAKRVKAKKAFGQTTFYSTHARRRLAQKMFQDTCQIIAREKLKNDPKSRSGINCDRQMDPVGVPYVLIAQDMKEVAPLWRLYLITIKQQFEFNSTFQELYDRENLDISWCAEMYAFNFASAHLKIDTKIVRNLQVRDFSKQPTKQKDDYSHRPTIHMWRAWFPLEHADKAEQWRNPVTDERELSRQKHLGVLVWNKHNETASSIQPWPLPEGLDFVSYHTMRILHESKQHFGEIPRNESFRKPNEYYWSAP